MGNIISALFVLAGFPASGKIMETWKMKKTFYQIWKNHGIWEKPQKPGKIMEFRKINLEKSWNFVSDLKLYESNFFARYARISSIHLHIVHELRALPEPRENWMCLDNLSYDCGYNAVYNKVSCRVSVDDHSALDRIGGVELCKIYGGKDAMIINDHLYYTCQVDTNYSNDASLYYIYY